MKVTALSTVNHDGKVHKRNETFTVSDEQAEELLALSVVVEGAKDVDSQPDKTDILKAAEDAHAEAEKVLAEATKQAKTVEADAAKAAKEVTDKAAEDATNRVAAAETQAKEIVANAKKPSQN